MLNGTKILFAYKNIIHNEGIKKKAGILVYGWNINNLKQNCGTSSETISYTL